MAEVLRSVGLDVGTTSTQMILSELTVENRAGSFAVPEMTISRRVIRYRSPIHFTPLISGELVDADKLRQIVDDEYRKAGIRKSDVDTGAIIVTGETSRKENARAVLEALSAYAGEFVVATAGPDLESVLAAKGSGAVEYSRDTGKTVLHMDIGGGTTNLARIENGIITATACLNVGGRLVKVDPGGVVTEVSPVLAGIFDGKPGDRITREELLALARYLTGALEQIAGLAPGRGRMEHLATAGSDLPPEPLGDGNTVISFSGGVADCIGREHPFLAFGDLGPELGQAIRESRLCAGEYVLGRETIRATVIGAGCHSAQLSGSTVYYQNIPFPLKNLPVLALSGSESPDQIRAMTRMLDKAPVIAMAGEKNPGYDRLAELARTLCAAFPQGLCLALEQDMAKALGQLLAMGLGPEARILCIDRVKLEQGSYLDVGAPVGPALPVVVKTLILET